MFIRVVITVPSTIDSVLVCKVLIQIKAIIHSVKGHSVLSYDKAQGTHYMNVLRVYINQMMACVYM